MSTDAPEPSPRLRLRDVRAIFRLVGEVRELGADPDAWRPHMVTALRNLLGAQFVVSSEIHFRKAAGGAVRVIDIGWISDTEGKVCKAHDEREQENFEDFWVAPEKDGESTVGPEELIPVKPKLKVHAGKSFILSQYALKHAG